VIDIVLGFGVDSLGPKSDAFRNRVEDFSKELLGSLGIGENLRVTLVADPSSKESGLDIFQISVNGRRCRQRVPVGFGKNDLADHLQDRVEQALFDNRAMLPNEAWPQAPGGMDAESLRAMVEEGMRRGYSAARVAQWAQNRPPNVTTGRPAELLFEDVAGAAPASPVCVYLGNVPVTGDTPDWRAELSHQIRSTVLPEMGIDPGVIAFETDSELGDTFRVALNDLKLPPQRRVLRMALADEAEDAGRANFAALRETVVSKLRECAGWLLTAGDVASRMLVVERRYPALAHAAARYELPLLMRVLRLLLDDGGSIRDFRGILETLVATNCINPRFREDAILFPPYTAKVCDPARGTLDQIAPADLADAVRAGSQRFWTVKCSARGFSGIETKDGGVIFDGDRLYTLLLNPGLEREINELNGGDLPEAAAHGMHVAIARTLDDLERGRRPEKPRLPMIVLTHGKIRREVARAIDREFPGLPVLSYQELFPDSSIEPIGRIEVQRRN
jgi:hypothetical protein